MATAALATSDIPEFLTVMRAMTGIVETPGASDNPKIMAMAAEIAKRYPEMRAYCSGYTHDSIPWCGLTVAYCMAMAGIRPPFGSTDTKRFLWARAWSTDPGYEKISKPRLGCVAVLTRSGGGHVSLFERTEGSSVVLRGGNQGDAINAKSFPAKDVIGYFWPVDEAQPLPDVPEPTARRLLQKGDTGADVAALQKTLGIPSDGEYGSVTEAAVQGFQAATGLETDGVCGDATWTEIDALAGRLAGGGDGLPQTVKDAVVKIASEHSAASINWPDRGQAPAGYIPGMALCYALAVTWLPDDSADIPGFTRAMAQAAGNPSTDALAYLAPEFARLDMDNSSDGIDTLRHLFVLLVGLGMRESSGQYCEGRDTTAANVTADTAEAGLFQMSWNMRTAHPYIPELLEYYLDDPNGFLPTFRDGVTPNAADLQVYGSGAGATYQWLAKYCPAFAVMTAAIGLRTRRSHWGPVNRREVTLSSTVNDLLLAVQGIISQVPELIEPVEPPPVAKIATVDIVTTGDVRVTVNGVVVV